MRFTLFIKGINMDIFELHNAIVKHAGDDTITTTKVSKIICIVIMYSIFHEDDVFSVDESKVFYNHLIGPTPTIYGPAISFNTTINAIHLYDYKYVDGEFVIDNKTTRSLFEYDSLYSSLIRCTLKFTTRELVELLTKYVDKDMRAGSRSHDITGLYSTESMRDIIINVFSRQQEAEDIVENAHIDNLTDEWMAATNLRVMLTSSRYDNIECISTLRELAWSVVEALDKRDGR